MSDFFARLNTILSGRKVNPWGKSLGMSGSVITAINSGNAPGPEYLTLISKAEGASIDYLLTGKGQPFTIEQVGAEDLIRFICFPAHQTLKIYLAKCKAEVLMAVQRHCTHHIKKREINYQEFELLTCKATEQLVDVCHKHKNVIPVGLDDPQYQFAISGQAGANILLGSDNTPGLMVKRKLAETRFTDFYADLTQSIKNSQKISIQASRAEQIDKELLISLLSLVDSVIRDLSEHISPSEKAQIISSLYCTATKQNLDAASMNKQTVLSMIELFN